MTRRMPVLPVLPVLTCHGCPCKMPTLGHATMRCRVCGEELWTHMPQRTYACVADELAWRNVCAGLFAVAVHLSTEYGFGVVEQYWCIRKNFGDDACTCKWCKPVPDAQKPAPA